MKPAPVIATAAALAVGFAALAQERTDSLSGAGDDGALLATSTTPARETGEAVVAAIPMMPSHNPAIGAIPPQVEHEVLGAFAPRPEDIAGALPPPPQKVVLDPGYYGAVTLDHAAHLARRAPCKNCHGPGPVRKIGRFTPARAHESCRGCHAAAKRGPTDCRGCHVVKEQAVEIATTDAGGSKAANDAGQPGRKLGEHGPAEMSGPAAEAAVAAAFGPPPAPDPLMGDMRLTIGVGFSMLEGTGHLASPGALVRFDTRLDRIIFSQSLEWGGDRAIGLIGAGMTFPIRSRWTAHALGVGGFDALDGTPAHLMPVAGLRGGCEWRGGQWLLHSIDLSVSATMDLGDPRNAYGDRVGGLIVSTALSAGFDLGRR